MSAATWTKRDPYLIGTQVGNVHALVYSTDRGQSWQVNVDRAGHLEEHAEGFPTSADAMHHALAYLENNGPAGSEPTGPGRPPKETTREGSLIGASTT